MFGFPKTPGETMFALYKANQVIPNTYAWTTIQFADATPFSSSGVPVAGDRTYRYDPLTYILWPQPGLLIGHLYIYYESATAVVYNSRIIRDQSWRRGTYDYFMYYTSVCPQSNYNHGVVCSFLLDVEPGDGFYVQLSQGFQTSNTQIRWTGYSLNHKNFHGLTNQDAGSQYFINYPSAKMVMS